MPVCELNFCQKHDAGYGKKKPLILYIVLIGIIRAEITTRYRDRVCG